MDGIFEGTGGRVGKAPSLMRGDAVVGELAPTPVRVLIATDVRLYGDGLAQALRTDGRLVVAATAAHVSAALALLRELRPRVILLDAGMPNGLAVARIIRRELPEIGIVAFAVSDVSEEVLACVEAGATAYLSRDATVEDLVLTVDRVTRGETHCEPRVTAAVFRRLAELSDVRPPARETPVLTDREVEIVALIDQGLTNKEIAGRLRICVATVKNHVHNILEKLQVNRRAEAAAQLRYGRDR